jgi:uncharacterized OB-fold protein
MKRPLPLVTPETRPFWDGCAHGELRYQACSDCGAVQRLPRTRCAGCHGGALEWRRAAGRGRILSHTTVHRAPTPAFRDVVPYVIALIDLDEGFRLMVNVAGGEQPDLAIGAVVDIGFCNVDGCALPEARLVR